MRALILLLLAVITPSVSIADQTIVVEIPGQPTMTCRRAATNCPLLPCSSVSVEGVPFSPMLRLGPPGSTPFLTLHSESALGPLWRNFRLTDSQTHQNVYDNFTANEGPDKTGFAPIESIVGVNSLNSYNATSFALGRVADEAHCGLGDISSYIERERRLIRQTNQNAEARGYAMLVEEVAGVLSSQLIPRFLLPPTACHRVGDVYYRSAQALTTQFEDRFFESQRGSAISTSQLSALMLETASRTDIPFSYLEDGCYARSHRIAHDLTTRGIYVEKVWVMGPDIGNPFGVRWAFHTAPVVWVQTPSGVAERRVIDPSVSPEAVPVNEWLSRITGRTNPPSTEVGWPPLRIPTANTLLVSYSPHYVYLPTEPLATVTGEQKVNRLNQADQWIRENRAQ